MTITVSLEDSQGWSWTEDVNVVGGRNDDEVLDNVIEHIQECFAPGWDARGREVSGPARATACVGNHYIEVAGDNGEDVSIY